MAKSIILIIVILLAIVFSGLTVSKDVTSSFKAIPEVQQFLSEHPTAKITTTYWSKEEVEKSANEISQQCDKTITPVAMYKATVSEGDLKLVSWINADTQIVLCSVSQGDNDLVMDHIPKTDIFISPYIIYSDDFFDISYQKYQNNGISLNVAINVANVGTEPMSAVVVNIPYQKNFSVIGSNSSVLGTLNPGDYSPAVFNLRKISETDNGLEVEIQYTDINGKRHTIRRI
jgi:hypothetical protein